MELRIKILIIGIIIVFGFIGLMIGHEILFKSVTYSDDTLQYILDDCNDPSWYMTFKEFSNGTHTIDNERCHWIPIS